jgi:hypothetical protein
VVDAGAVPTLDLDGSEGSVIVDFSTSFVEGGSAISIVDPTVVITDDNNTILGATVVFTLDGGPLELSDLVTVGSLPPGISVDVFDFNTGTLTLTGAASPALYQVALQAIQYSNDGTGNSDDRVVTITVNDGASQSNVAQTTIVFNNIIADAIDDNVSAIRGVALEIDVLANDTNGAFSSVTAVGAASNGTVSLNSSTGAVTYTASTGSVATTDSFTYTNSDGDTATVNVVISDSFVPEVNGVENLVYTEGDGAKNLLGVQFEIDSNDPNGGNTVEQVVVSLTNYDPLYDTLSYTALANISASEPAVVAGVWQLILTTNTGSAVAIADYETLLRSITFTNNEPDIDTTPRTLTVEAFNFDAANTLVSGVGTAAVVIAEINSPPEAVDDIISLGQGLSYDFASLSPITDLDNNSSSLLVTITSIPNGGSLTLSGAPLSNGDTLTALQFAITLPA